MKKIIALLTAFSIISLLFTATVHAEDPILSLYLPWDTASGAKSYTPDTSGFYRVYYDAYFSDDILSEITVPLTVYNTSDNSAVDYIFDYPSISKGMVNYINLYYYLEAGKEYRFDLEQLIHGDRTYLSGFKLYTTSSFKNTGTLSDVSSAPLSLTKTGYYYLSFIPEKDGIIKLDLSSESSYAANYCTFYSTSTGKAARFSENQLTAEVSEGMLCIMAIDHQQGIYSYTYTFNIEYLKIADNTPVISDNISDFQSSHPYECYLDKTWTYNASANTEFIEIVFDGSSYIGKGDMLSIYNDNNDLLCAYQHQSLANMRILIEGSGFNIHFSSDLDNTGYGFKLSQINCYNEFPVPQINRTPGKTRPFRAELSAPQGIDIYYKISGSTKDYKLYTEPFIVENDSIICTYSSYGEYMSDKIFYYFEIDSTTPPAPVITVDKKSDSEIQLSLSADDGIIYYKRMLADSNFKEYISGTPIIVTSEDIIEAYTLAGNNKSDTVFYVCDIENQSSDLIHTPNFTITPVLGGKQITFNIPDEIKLGYTYEEIGVAESHDSSKCMNAAPNSPYIHGDDWQINESTTYAELKTSDGINSNTSRFENNNKLPKSFTITQDTSLAATIYTTVHLVHGLWETTINENGMPMFCNMLEPSSEINETYKSDTVALLVEVPKATAPVIQASRGKATISFDNGLTAYYSVNSGSFAKYTDSLTISDGDIITAYTEGIGVARSNEVTHTVNFAGSTTSVSALQKVNTEITSTPTISPNAVNNIDIKANSSVSIEDAALIISAYDIETKTLAGVFTKDISLQTGDNTFENLYVNLDNSFEHIYLKLFIWDTDTLKPICADKLMLLN